MDDAAPSNPFTAVADVPSELVGQESTANSGEILPLGEEAVGLSSAAIVDGPGPGPRSRGRGGRGGRGRVSTSPLEIEYNEKLSSLIWDNRVKAEDGIELRGVVVVMAVEAVSKEATNVLAMSIA